MFTPVPVEVPANEAEITGLDLLHKTKYTKLRQVDPIPDLAKISEGTMKLEHMLDAVLAYVEGVIEGKEPPNNAVGRKLLDLVHSVPKMTPDEFEKMTNSNMKASRNLYDSRSGQQGYGRHSSMIFGMHGDQHFCMYFRSYLGYPAY